MKKALIISYHFPPLDVIASYRAKAYADHLVKHDIFPTIITHRWETDDFDEDGRINWKYHTDDSVIEEEEVGCKIYRLPRRKPNLKKQPSLLSKVTTLLNFLSGNLEPYLEESRCVFEKFLFDHLKYTSYNFIIAIFSPHYHLKLAYDLNRIFKIPYILDFRDLWNNRIIHRNYHPSIKEKLEDIIIKHYWKKWLSNACFFAITSEPWLNQVKSFSDTPGVVVTNGYEEDIFTEANKSFNKNNRFTIVHAGSLYHHQRLDIIFEGLRLFRQKGIDNFVLQLVGAARKKIGSKSMNSFFYEVDALLEAYIPQSNYLVTARFPKEEAAKYLLQADLLIFPSFPDAPGTYAGKVFDYLGANRKIVVVPDDHSVVSELMTETCGGEIVNTSEELADFLEKNYSLWLKKGFIPYDGKINIIEKYKRSSQVAIMANYINSLAI